MIRLLNFKSLFCSCLVGIIFLSVTACATQHELKIEIYDTGRQQRFVNAQGYIEDEYKERFHSLINVSLKTVSRDDFKKYLKNKPTRSVIAKNAAKIFFDSCGYKMHEKNYSERMQRLIAAENTLPSYG